MKILLIVVKNTSAIDYALPILWKIRRAHPEANLAVLYCAISRNKILRKSRFYSSVLKECAIPQYDFADFLKQPYSMLGGFWRSIFSASNWDLTPGDFMGSPYRRLRGLALRALKKAESFLGRAVDIEHILPALNPDVVLLDNRSETRFYGREHFFEYFKRAAKKIMLLPHAPHHTGTAAFTPFDERGERLPDYCEYWMPFKFDTPWVHIPEKRQQFMYVGYPGLDNEWLDWLKTKSSGIRREAASKNAGLLRCLFIIRKFLEKGETKPPGHDEYIFSHEEFSRHLGILREAVARAGTAVEIVVKPHPSNNYEAVRAAMEASGIPLWSISHEPIYAHVNSIDYVVSLYSTTLLIPAMAGIPVFLLKSRIQDEIHKWLEMKNLYSGLHFYLENPAELVARFPEVAKTIIAGGNERAVWRADTQHLRNFYPDGALGRALERLGL